MTWSVLREAAVVGAAKGVALDDGIVERMMDRFRAINGPVVSSMYTDLQRGSRLEIDVLNGAVSRMGKDLGVATPANDFITASLLVSHNRAVAQRSSSGS
jgi:2-dehydropantoate 2-reductase